MLIVTVLRQQTAVKVVDAGGNCDQPLRGQLQPLVHRSGSYPGWWDGTVVVPDAGGDVEARLPNGVLLAGDSAGIRLCY